MAGPKTLAESTVFLFRYCTFHVFISNRVTFQVGTRVSNVTHLIQLAPLELCHSGDLNKQSTCLQQC